MAGTLPGSHCRKEMDKVVTRGLVSRGFQFIRGRVTRQCHYTCCKTDASLLHHGNDTRIGALDRHLDFLQADEDLGKYLDVKNGGIETSDTKLRTQDSFSHTLIPNIGNMLAWHWLHKRDLARVTCLNAENKASGVLTAEWLQRFGLGWLPRRSSFP